MKPKQSRARLPRARNPANRRALSPGGLTVPEMQLRVHAWISQFEAGYWPPLSMLARLTEEVGELARELNHEFGHKPKKPDELEGDLALEIADIVFVLVCLCNSLGIDLAEAFERVLLKYDERDAHRWAPRRDIRSRSGSRGRKTSRGTRPSRPRRRG
jgi:NTP pyrophosphatase (non-canonical NTP hydrolase)